MTLTTLLRQGRAILSPFACASAGLPDIRTEAGPRRAALFWSPRFGEKDRCAAGAGAGTGTLAWCQQAMSA